MNMLSEAILRGFAIFYLAYASEDFTATFRQKLSEGASTMLKSWLIAVLGCKPFVCGFCLCFWWSLILWLIMPIGSFIMVFALAGVGYLIYTTCNRLMTLL